MISDKQIAEWDAWRQRGRSVKLYPPEMYRRANEVPCEQCGDYYVRRQKNQRWCSETCRHRHHTLVHYHKNKDKINAVRRTPEYKTKFRKYYKDWYERNLERERARRRAQSKKDRRHKTAYMRRWRAKRELLDPRKESVREKKLRSTGSGP
jgi:hypothetical protein